MNNSDHSQSIRCFDIGGSKIVAADVSPSGDLHEVGRCVTPVDNINEFFQAVGALCANDTSPVCISIAGVIHPQTGLMKSANVPCISGRVLSRELSTYLGRPVSVINDANAFALAEAGFGRAIGHEVVLAVILGTGIGGGIVVNSQILAGADGTAGEWGHSASSANRTNADLPIIKCNCGQSACVDTLGGARGLERLYRHVATENALPLDSRAIINAWIYNDSLAMQVVDVWLDVVGGALASAVNLLGPSIVAVGGGLANSVALIEALDVEVRDRCLASFQVPLLYRAVSGPEQGLLGAAIHGRSQTL